MFQVDQYICYLGIIPFRHKLFTFDHTLVNCKRCPLLFWSIYPVVRARASVRAMLRVRVRAGVGVRVRVQVGRHGVNGLSVCAASLLLVARPDRLILPLKERQWAEEEGFDASNRGLRHKLLFQKTPKAQNTLI